MKLFHWLRVPRNFRTPVRACRPFFVVKFHTNLFNGSLAIANKRGDELFVARRVYTCTHVRICVPWRPHVHRTRAFVLSFSLHASFCRTGAKNIKLILYLMDARILLLSFSFSCISFCRDNRAILNRHEADNFFPLLRRETAQPCRSPAKIPESIFSNIHPTFDICKLYTYERAVRAAWASERASRKSRTRSVRAPVYEREFSQ